MEVMKSITSTAIIKKLRSIFTLFGLPVRVYSDNGRQFISAEIEAYCREIGVDLRHTTPYWPAANGEVERQNSSILKRLKIAQHENKDRLIELQNYLSMYYSVVHPSTGKTPAEILFGRQYRTKLPTLIGVDDHADDDEIRDNDAEAKLGRKLYRDNKLHATRTTIEEGDEVVLKNMQKENKLALTFNPERFVVAEKNGDVIIVRSQENGRMYRRSVNHAKAVPVQIPGSDDIEEQDRDGIDDSSRDQVISGSSVAMVPDALQNDSIVDRQNATTRRPSRCRQIPGHLNDYILE